MSRSLSGFLEAYILSMDALDEFAAGQSLPSGSYVVPCGISGPKELKPEDFDPPVDEYNNKLRNKINFPFTAEIFESDWETWERLKLFTLNGGVDLIIVSEGCEEYEGNSSGIETPGGGVWWRRNPNRGIFFFEKLNQTHLGIGWEFQLTPKQQSLRVTLEAALNYYKARNIFLNSQTNFIHRDNISLPWRSSTKQIVPDLKEFKILIGSTWYNIIDPTDFVDFNFTARTVSNKRTKDNRELVNNIEIDLRVTGADASPSKINSLLNYEQFSNIKLIVQYPDGTDYTYNFTKNSITNTNAPMLGREKREVEFRMQGRVSLLNFEFDDANRICTIGA
ncbi:MAG: hypothetical protein Kow0098_03690 [Ignavibacteriaceae bacterium]